MSLPFPPRSPSASTPSSSASTLDHSCKPNNTLTTLAHAFTPHFDLRCEANRQWLAGGLAGAVGTVVGQPLDSIKVWLQSQSPLTASHRSAALPTPNTSFSSPFSSLGVPSSISSSLKSQPELPTPSTSIPNWRWQVIRSNIERGGWSVLMQGTWPAVWARFIISGVSFSTLSAFRSVLHAISPSFCTASDISAEYRQHALQGKESIDHAAITNSTSLSVEKDINPLLTTFSAAFLSGIVLTFITCPLDLVKIQLQNQFSLLKSAPSTSSLPSSFLPSTSSTPQWHGSAHFAMDTWRRFGLRSLFLGMSATALRTPLFWGVYYTSYEACTSFFNGFTETGYNDVGSMRNSLVILLGGSVAGGLGWAINMPIDVIKTRIQTQPLHLPRRYRGAGIMDCAREIYRESGWRGFLLGGVPSVARGMLVNAVVFLAYEHIFKAMGGPAKRVDEEPK